MYKARQLSAFSQMAVKVKLTLNVVIPAAVRYNRRFGSETCC